ncbi:MAG TPA: PAS domain-containing protein [Exilispira sp.]|nr:PAS domain-containing protein [Exilispira sp.]
MNLYNESIFHKLFEQSLVGYWEWDILSGDLYISPNFKILLGYDISEIKNNIESFKKIIFEEDFINIQEKYKQHIESKGKSPFYDEIRIIHKDKSIVWAIYTGEIVKTDERGNPAKMAGFFIDITKQKKNRKRTKRI